MGQFNNKCWKKLKIAKDLLKTLELVDQQFNFYKNTYLWKTQFYHHSLF